LWVNNQLVAMPTLSQMEASDLDLVISGTKSAITMIEGFAREMKEEEMLQAIHSDKSGEVEEIANNPRVHEIIEAEAVRPAVVLTGK
jgi:polyribonucleotide nucleotidyltransferase